MGIWEHRGRGKTDFRYGNLEERCPYCGTGLLWKELRDRWGGISKDVRAIHRQTILSMMEAHGDYILDELELIRPPVEHATQLGRCPVCGWWRLFKEVFMDTPGQYWHATWGTCGTLKTLDLTDLHTPLDELRQYLAVRYEERFHIHPKAFEEVTASVFRSLGYAVEATAYTRDGGIDVILNGGPGKQVGVQVKRHRQKIEVAQIRELLGAMVLGGLTQGIFVTVSDYRRGARKAARSSSAAGTPIELVDGTAFLHLLNVAQIKDFQTYPEFLETEDIRDLPLDFEGEYHMNSL